jgi:hypothetical protein
LCVILKKIKQYALKPSKGSFSLHKSWQSCHGIECHNICQCKNLKLCCCDI